MTRFGSVSLLVVCGLALAAPRWLPEKPGAGRARITIYRIAPGKHLDFSIDGSPGQ